MPNDSTSSRRRWWLLAALIGVAAWVLSRRWTGTGATALYDAPPTAGSLTVVPPAAARPDAARGPMVYAGGGPGHGNGTSVASAHVAATPTRNGPAPVSAAPAKPAPAATPARPHTAPAEPAAAERAAPAAERAAPAAKPAAPAAKPAAPAAKPAAPAAKPAAAKPAAPAAPTPETDAEPGIQESSYGPGSALPLPDGSAPSPEYTIKGNATSMLFHTPSSPYFGRTKAEAWFRTPEDARRAGFTEWTRKPRARRAD